MICDAQLHKVTGARFISDDAIYVIRYILSRDISSVYSFDISIKILEEIEKLADDYLGLHSDRSFKSLDILQKL